MAVGNRRRHPEPRDLNEETKLELRSELRRVLGFDPHDTGRLRVAELRRAIRRLDEQQDDQPLNTLQS